MSILFFQHKEKSHSSNGRKVLHRLYILYYILKKAVVGFSNLYNFYTDHIFNVKIFFTLFYKKLKKITIET